MIQYLLLGLAAIIIVRKRKQSGVGKLKVWQLIDRAQQSGVQFGDKWDKLSPEEQRTMSDIASDANYKQSPKSRESGKQYGEAFYNYLNGKYKQVAGIGKTRIEYPYVESHVHNEYGDLVLVHRDYDKERDTKNAIDAVDDMLTTDPVRNGYLLTLQYIARGGKVVWNSLKKGDSVIKRGLAQELFGKNDKLEYPKEEKRLRRGILGSEAKGAKYPEQLAEEFAHGGDDTAYKNGVLEALMQVGTKQQAKEELLRIYYDAYFTQEVPDGEYDAPF